MPPAAFSREQVAELVALLRRRYPDWDSFANPALVANEIAGKRELAGRANELLGEEALAELLAGWQHDEVIRRLEQLGRGTNLLWNRVPRQGDLAILYRPDLDRAEFAIQLRRLLYGAAPSPERLEAFGTYARRHYLPNRWPFPTFFLFLTHPETELFVQPQVARWFLRYLGLPALYSAAPSAEVYRTLRDGAAVLGDALQRYGPRDMIDMQSFLWVCARESRARTGHLDLEGQIELEIDHLADELPRAAPAGDVTLPPVGDLLEPLFQAFKLLGGAASVTQLEEQVASLLGLSAAQLALRRSGSRQSLLSARLGQARTRLKQRGLIALVERGRWELTVEGRAVPFVTDAQHAAVLQVTDPLETDGAAVREPAPTYAPPYSLGQLARDTGYAEATLRSWLQAVERKKQAIFYGPPGTGKTFLAQRLARFLTGNSDGVVDLVQFHPAYAYEDFIQGIRPVSQPNGSLTYEMVPGRFLQFCAEARRREGICVLVIDEINRANLSRVFGELMYLLEYREQEIPLAGGGMFSIPANVRLLGTMNTADRSVALVDHAMRRRFAFIALQPDYDLLRRFHEEEGGDFPVEPLITLLQEVNARIADPHYALGITYFLRGDLAQQLPDIWRTEVEPYLEEYFFDQPEQVDLFRWKRVAARFPGVPR
jgi:MoxR-like ATPase